MGLLLQAYEGVLGLVKSTDGSKLNQVGTFPPGRLSRCPPGIVQQWWLKGRQATQQYDGSVVFVVCVFSAADGVGSDAN